MDERTLFETVTRLLTQSLVSLGHSHWHELLGSAFNGRECDPRPRLKTLDTAKGTASEWANLLIQFGPCDLGCHSLAALLREAVGNPEQSPSGYREALAELDARCDQPTREQELHYFNQLLALDAYGQNIFQEAGRIYVPLDGAGRQRLRQGSGTAPALWRDRIRPDLVHRPYPMRGQQPAETCRYGDVQEAFAMHRRWVLLGKPGAGKTTALLRLAWDRIEHGRTLVGGEIPFFVRLGYWTDESVTSADFDRFFRAQVGPFAGFLHGLCRQGRALILLDGLNETPTGLREAKTKGLREWIAGLPGQPAVAVSCRSDDYPGLPSLELDTLDIEPLSPPRIRLAIANTFKLFEDLPKPDGLADHLFWELAGGEDARRLLEKWQSLGATEAQFWEAEDIPRETPNVYSGTTGAEDRLWQDLRGHRSRSLLSLASTPYLLTLIIQEWLDSLAVPGAETGTLPHNRASLFAAFVDRLMVREGLIRLNPQNEIVEREAVDVLLKQIGELAWGLQNSRIAQEGERGGDAGVLTSLPLAQAKASLGDTGLKQAIGAGMLDAGADVRFKHQLLQEYFTALGMRERFLRGQLDAVTLWPKQQWWRRSGWEEATVLLAGLFEDDPMTMVDCLSTAQPEVLAQCLLDGGMNAPEPEVLARLGVDWTRRMLNDVEEPPQSRAALGRALGLLGLDLRHGVGLDSAGLPAIKWIDIPAGEFIYQDGKRQFLPAFKMACYPITHAQFQAFINDSGYGDPRWWQGLAQHYETPESSPFLEPNHPRVMVNWYEAMAFCAWLSHRTGQTIRLPTEYEWERAARGKNGLAYPWGKDWQDNRANTDESGIGKTSAVGIFPAGASPDGVCDLSGNVWEWCLNEYSDIHAIQPGGERARSLRGGSWFNDRVNARADYRHYNLPYDRYSGYGFRVVLVSPILDTDH